MDVNGTRFHLVLAGGEWLGDAASKDVAFVEDALRLQPVPARARERIAERPPLQAQRRGAGRDRYGNWYVIGEDRRSIRTLAAGHRSAAPFWSLDDRAVPVPATPGGFTPALVPARRGTLAGAAVTHDHYLVVGRRDPGGLLVFDLHGGGAPLEARWPAHLELTPHDIAAAHDGGAWILDASAKRIWRLDRWLRILAPAHLPGGGRGIEQVRAPIAIEALPDGSVIVLDAGDGGAASLVRFDADHAHPAVFPLDVAAFDIAAVGTSHPVQGLDATVYVTTPDGNQSLAYSLEGRGSHVTLRVRPDYLPMRRFSGKGIVSDGGRAYYDSDDRWFALVEQPNPRHATEGSLELPADGSTFDGREPQCVWHRLVFDGCIPADASVTIECRAADSAELIGGLPWRAQPTPYRRGDGAELAYHDARRDGGARDGSYELLFQDVVGRHLQLRVTLGGNGRVTPRMRAMRIHYPRFSYLREYLPAAYREDRVSASFLDRFLANVEGTYTTIEERIANAQVLFDVRTVPAEYLDWLASWMGLTLEMGWTDRTRRLFLRHAPQHFRERGTCPGMVRALRFALSSCVDDSVFADVPCGGESERPGFGVRVLERFRIRRAAGVVLGDPTDLAGPGSTADASGWVPAHGAEPLHQRWRAWLRRRYGTAASLAAAWNTPMTSLDDPTLRLPAVRPPGARGDAWQRFVERDLGFTYGVATAADEPLYREFLAERHGQPADVNAAYGLTGASRLATFADVRARIWDGMLAHSIPASGPMLRDWIAFASTVLPLRRASHRFTVLVPVVPTDSPDEQRRKRELAARVAAIEKPAHTAFDVRLYWGMFRAGEARLGLDTVLGPGSRSTAIVLGESLIGAGHLSHPDAARAPGRATYADETLRAASPAACCTRA